MNEISSLSKKEKKYSKGFGKLRNSSARVIFTLFFTALAVIFGSFLFVRQKDNQRIKEVRQETLSKIQRLIEDDKQNEAFELALKTEKFLPNDSIFNNLFSKVSNKINLKSHPTSSEIYTRLINTPDSLYRF